MNLNENYRIVYDSENCILQYYDQRERKVKGSDTKESFEYTENFYYPNLKTALVAFLNKATWGLETAEQVLSEIKRVEAIIIFEK
jgi:hypothetical protein